ncbi:MAG: SPOR domain-containing protein [Nannocystaceae bacterium]
MTATRRQAALLSLCIAPLALTLARDAHACFDGVVIDGERTSIALETDATWSPEAARHWARWVGRIDALVPQGQRLVVSFGAIEVCRDGHVDCVELPVTWDDGRAFTLFELAADHFAPGGTAVAAARRSGHTPLTVQVASSRDATAAAALVDRIDAAELGLEGFYSAGGFPSSHGYAHVVESWDELGARYDVVVGAFLDRDHADEAAMQLQETLDLRGFVRRLDQATPSDEGC